MKLLRYVIAWAMLAGACGCSTTQRSQPDFSGKEISQVLARMTELMVHDVTNPPLAARFFSYTLLSGYEISAQHNHHLRSMQGRLNGYPKIPTPTAAAASHYQLAAILAMLETAGRMQPSGKRLKEFENQLIDSCRRAGMNDVLIDSSLAYAAFISQQILKYAKADGYSRISNLPRYTPIDKEGCWYPTPPAYIAAVEPYFKTVRPFTLDSASQFKPVAPVAFSSLKASPFYKMLQANAAENGNAPEEHRIIAGFWDCNPFAVQDEGHLSVGLKKISPGAHWLGITGIACMQAKKNFDECMEINSMVAIGLMDSFIACWDEKFRSNRIRPETAIRKYLDVNWKPLLQTPPFPEYLSGHSCISATSATILTHYLGERFAYRDSIEVAYGLAPRNFSSFRQAADEAGISRFYGGIHFMDAITNGQAQGLQVGAWVLKKMEQRK